MMDDNTEAQKSSLAAEEMEEIQHLFQDVLNEIFKGTGDNFDNTKFALSRTLPREGTKLPKGESEPDWDLTKLYMTVLRGQR